MKKIKRIELKYQMENFDYFYCNNIFRPSLDFRPDYSYACNANIIPFLLYLFQRFSRLFISLRPKMHLYSSIFILRFRQIYALNVWWICEQWHAIEFNANANSGFLSYFFYLSLDNSKLTFLLIPFLFFKMLENPNEKSIEFT